MALTDIVGYDASADVFEQARGNIGSVTEIIIRSAEKDVFELPEKTGTGGGEVSVVF